MDKMSNEDTISRLAKVEQWKESSERRIEKLENDSIPINRLTIIVEMQQKTMESINATLSELKDGNKEISHEIKGIKEDIGEVKTDFVQIKQKVETIEASDKISISQSKRELWGKFIYAIVGLLAGYLWIKFGLK